jgi:phage terminase large subunit-like protein
VKPLDLLGSLRLEDGRRWRDAALDFQLADARAILEGKRPYAFLTRPRGASKTTDLAGIATALLLTAGARERSYWLAADVGQGRLCIDAITGFVDRTPGLREALTLTGSSAEARSSGARLDVLAADTASSWGLRPAAVYCDEISQWPDATAPRRLWESVSSAVAKVPDARLVALCTAGDPAHFSRAILDHAIESPMWHVHEVAGPTPWMSEERLAEQRARLLPSTFARLFLNEWTAGEDRLASSEDLRACATLDGPLEPDRAHRYVLSLDVGLKRDRTVAVVAHLVDGRVVTVDRLAVWEGSHESPVLLQEVEDWIEQAARAYRARIICDPWQSVGLMQRLAARGLPAEEFAFSASSVGRLAATLFTAIRDHTLAMPDDQELLDELAHVRLRESSPGVFRMDHDSGRHDDRAIALGMAAQTLLQVAQAPVGLDGQIAALREEMRTRKARREPTSEALLTGEAGRSLEEEFGGTRRGSWKDRLDGDVPTWPSP